MDKINNSLDSQRDSISEDAFRISKFLSAPNKFKDFETVAEALGEFVKAGDDSRGIDLETVIHAKRIGFSNTPEFHVISKYNINGDSRNVASFKPIDLNWQDTCLVGTTYVQEELLLN